MRIAAHFSLSDAERLTLQALMLNGGDKIVRKRAYGLLKLHELQSPLAVGECLQVKRQTIYNWLSAWNNKGLVGLLARPKAGRPPSLDDSIQAVVLQLTEDEGGSAKQILGRLCQHQGWDKPPCGEQVITRILKQGDMSYKRTRYSLKKNETKPTLSE